MEIILTEIILTFIILFSVCAISYLILRYKRNKKDSEVDRIDVVEKDIDAEARYFISVVYKSGRSELITPKALTEIEVVEQSLEFLDKLK